MTSLSENASSSSSKITSFYRGKSVFITGSTGFLGKVLVEKLLRSCPALKTIYLLIRPKKGREPHERLSEIIDVKLFDKVKTQYSEAEIDIKSKLCVVHGDLCSPGLGLSDETRRELIENVNIIFHSAATLRFDEPLKVAVEMNIIAVKKVIDLAKSLKNLKVFVHVSTAYSNCDRQMVTEEITEPRFDPTKLITVVESIEPTLLELITPQLIAKMPNTYTFTKSIAEVVVQRELAAQFPVCIVRPSIICSSWQEPFPGWVDNLYGPSAMVSALGTGIFRTMMGSNDLLADTIPVDTVSNTLIAASWFTAEEFSAKKKNNEEDESILVYNCTSGQINPVKWGEFKKHTFEACKAVPFERTVMPPYFSYSKVRVVNYVKQLYRHHLPACVADLVLRLQGKRTEFRRIHKKLDMFVNLMEYFTSNQWHFTNENLKMLMGQMDKQDSVEFNFDIRDLDWKQYVADYQMGCKVYLLKEDMGRIDHCRKRLKKLQNIQTLFIYMIYFALLSFVLFGTELGRDVYDLGESLLMPSFRGY